MFYAVSAHKISKNILITPGPCEIVKLCKYVFYIDSSTYAILFLLIVLVTFVLCKELVYKCLGKALPPVRCLLHLTYYSRDFQSLMIIPLLQDGIILREEEVTRGLL